jgi:hypothetical protein
VSAATATRAAEVNAVLPHSSEQIGLLHFLLHFLGDDVAFAAAVDAYLADKRAQRYQEVPS